MLIVNIINPYLPNVITPCRVEFKEYAYGRGLAVQLYEVEDGLPYAKVSVNVEDIQLASNEFIFKNYAENEGMIEAMIDAKIIELTSRTCRVGYTICPIVRVLKFK